MNTSQAQRPDAQPNVSTPRIVLLSCGLRPFFVLAAAHAVFGLPVWMARLHGMDLAGAPLPPLAWHMHEMLFGFVTAALAGFLLTAVPSWTARAPVTGLPLLALVLTWLAGRCVMTLPLGLPPLVGACVDVAFVPLLGAMVVPAIVRSGKHRNLIVVLFLLLLVVSNAWFHVLVLRGEPVLAATRLALNTIALMLVVMGGRIVPAFTASWLGARGRAHAIAQNTPLDAATIVATAAILLVDLVLPHGAVSGGVAAVAACLLLLRLARWRGHQALREPIVWILHVAYAWLPIAFALKATAAFGIGLAGASWTHALTTGAFSSMILAVMSRASLGHTGRPIVASPLTVAAYATLTAAALMRVFGSALEPAAWTLWLAAAGLLYTAAFALFLVVYAPILCRPRADGRPG